MSLPPLLPAASLQLLPQILQLRLGLKFGPHNKVALDAYNIARPRQDDEIIIIERKFVT
jgi:hypothetical protein